MSRRLVQDPGLLKGQMTREISARVAESAAERLEALPGALTPGTITKEPTVALRLYISGPMTGRVGHNFPAFNQAAERLRVIGFEVENPADKGIVDGWSWSDYMRYDIVKLMECQGVALLPGWTSSRGARLEKNIADRLGMPVRTVEDWIDEQIEEDV